MPKTNLDIRKPCRVAFPLGVLAIVALSLAPPGDVPDPGSWDKFNHALAYCLVATAGFLGYPGRRRNLAILIAMLLLGGVLELVQMTLSGRHGSAADVLANGVGLVVALLGVALVESWLKPRGDGSAS